MSQEIELLPKVFSETLKSRAEKDYNLAPILSIYKTLFEMTDYSFLKYVYEEYKKDPTQGEWFVSFHKSIRQTDFFNDIKGVRIENQLTDEQTTELKKLRKKREVLYAQFKKEHPDESTEAYREFQKTPERVELSKRLRELVDIEKTQVDLHLSGSLDSILYNMISMDLGVLYGVLERTFIEYNLQLRGI